MKELLKRTEVLYLVAHLAITVMVIGSYVFLKASGHEDQTLENLILIIGGWWFGALGKSAVGDMKTRKPTETESTTVVAESVTTKEV